MEVMRAGGSPSFREMERIALQEHIRRQLGHDALGVVAG
jgi:hypothetical protein